MKITKKELVGIIKEEAAKMKKLMALKNELATIEKELNEVRAGEVMDTAGVHAGQKKPVFTTNPKQPGLKMEDDIEMSDSDDIEMSDSDGIEMSDSDDVEMSDSEVISKEEVVNALEIAMETVKNELGLGEEVENGEETGDEFEFNEEDFEDKSENGDEFEESSEEEVEESSEEEKEKEEEEVEEIDECEMSEDGEEIANNDGKESMMEAEKRRMAVLAGIIKG